MHYAPADVLIVEDDIVSLTAMERQLADHADLRITTAANAERAFAIMRVRPPEVVVLDLGLPGISGDDVLQRIHAMPKLRHVPVIVATAYADREVELLEAGAHDFLAKPLDGATLVARVRAAVRTIRRLHDMRIQVEDLARLADTDALTGALNRRAGERIVDALSAGMDVTPFAAVMIDFDLFKRINDLHGHAAGDEALRATSAAIRATMRGHDHFVRWGGDEFLALLVGVDEGTAHRIAGRMRLAVAEASTTHDVSISLGVALHERGESAADVLTRADRELYADKTGAPSGVPLD